MAIIKNEIPILEFDTEQTAVLNPTHENLGLNLPEKCVFAFLGAYIDEYANKSDTKQVSTFVSATKHYPIYITKYKGEEIVDQFEIVDERCADNECFLKVQLWKYNPSYFAREGRVDPVSLACTFKGNEDERIEMSIEELLEEL